MLPQKQRPRGVRVAVSRWLDRLAGPVPRDSFVAYRWHLTARAGIVVSALFAAGLVLGWPSDRWLYDQPAVLDALAAWRLHTTIICAVGVAAGVVIARRAPVLTYAVYTAIGLALCAATGAMAGNASDLANAYYVMVVPFGMVAALMPLGLRATLTPTFSVAFLVAFSVAADTGPPAGLVMNGAFSCIVAVVFGEAYYRQVRASFHNERDLERRVAEQTEQLRRIADHLETTREDERRVIARELHDDISQLLTAVRMELSIAGDAGADHDSLINAARRADEIVDRIFELEKRILRSLRPPLLDDEGLIPAVDLLLEDFAQSARFSLEWQAEPIDRNLDDRIATAVFRIIQEGVTNAARHAGAENVRVDLSMTEDQLRVSIEDDGCGFSPDEVPATHLGLLGIRERAHALGGELRIHSGPGTGTHLALRLPLTPGAPERTEPPV